MYKSSFGKLYLIPNTLSVHSSIDVIPEVTKKIIKSLNCFVFENEKFGRLYIKKISSKICQKNLTVHILNKKSSENEIQNIIEILLNGNDMGLITDSGCPAIADPGSRLIYISHKKNIKVIPLVGPSSILLASMSSGLNGQSFSFNGYLPIEKSRRKSKIKFYERQSSKNNQTQIFIETPYRNESLFDDLCETLEDSTLLSIATNLTCESEFIKTDRISFWKKNKPSINRKPTIFSFLRI